jgi:hypothetical protein
MKRLSLSSGVVGIVFLVNDTARAVKRLDGTLG